MKYLFFFISILTIENTLSQTRIPVYRCDSLFIQTKDGNDEPQDWEIMPDVKLDIKVSTKNGEYVHFFTDRDTLSFLIHPDSVYNFVLLYNGTDSAYTQVKYEKSKLQILKDAADYNNADLAAFPPFTYQDVSDKNLVNLRKKYNLDSIAGTGDDVSKMVRVMHWLHDLVPHDGMNGNPKTMTADNMIQVCKKDKRGLNCRGLAITLNECYLALGIPSRYATCMPKDSIFDDCHVINMAFSKELQKWIWLDPTWDTYVKDEKGNFLSLEEVRYKIIHDEPMSLNPTGNWNHKENLNIDYYLGYYMAKNLYRVECPINSEYNSETNKKKKNTLYAELLPLDAYFQTPKKVMKGSKKRKWTVYKTNNPRLFWVKP